MGGFRPPPLPSRPARSVVLAAVAATAALFGASAAVLGGPPTELVVAASPLARPVPQPWGGSKKSAINGGFGLVDDTCLAESLEM